MTFAGIFLACGAVLIVFILQNYLRPDLFPVAIMLSFLAVFFGGAALSLKDNIEKKRKVAFFPRLFWAIVTGVILVYGVNLLFHWWDFRIEDYFIKNKKAVEAIEPIAAFMDHDIKIKALIGWLGVIGLFLIWIPIKPGGRAKAAG